MKELNDIINEKQQRIDKTIEYIETNKQHIEEYVYHWGSVEDYLDELLDILKGSDSNE